MTGRPDTHRGHTRDEAIVLARAMARATGHVASIAVTVGIIAGTAYVLGARITDAPTAILAFMAAAFGLSGGFIQPRRVVVTTVAARPYARHVPEHHAPTESIDIP